MPTVRPIDLAVFALASVAFALGAAPWLHWYDSPELATAAFQLAASHPPGQPLHAVLGKAATFLPLGSITFRVTLLSAVGAAAGVACTGAIGRRLLRLADPTASPRARQFATIAPAFALACSASLLGQATRTEVYGPAFALSAAGFALALSSLRGPVADARPLATAALLAGLAASIHPAAGLAVVMSSGVTLLFVAPRTLLRPRIVVASAVATLLGLFVLTYLPARTGPGVVPTWESLRTFDAFYRYAIGDAYRINAQGGLAAVRAIGGALRSVVLRTGILPAALWAGALVWLTVHPERTRVALAILGATLLPVFLLAVSPFEDANPDLQGYLLPVLSVLLASIYPLAAGGAPQRLAMPAGAVALAVAAVASAGRAEWRAGYDLPDLLVNRLLAEPPPRALVVVESDHVVFSTFYAQIVEGDRPDVGFLCGGFAHLPRHLDEVAAHRPFPRPITPDGTGEWRQTLVRGALKSLNGRAARVVERAVWDPPRAQSLGTFFTLDAVPGTGDASFPKVLERERDRRPAAYADGGDRIVLRIRYERGQSLWGRGRFGDGARELLAGLAHTRIAPWLRAALRKLPDDAPPGRYALTPMMTRPWIADERLLRTELARLAKRARRPDLGRALLTVPGLDADPEVALLRCELAGTGAAACYERLRKERPALAPLVDAGVARVHVLAGRFDDARRHLVAAKASGDAWAVSFAASVETELGQEAAKAPATVPTGAP